LGKLAKFLKFGKFLRKGNQMKIILIILIGLISINIFAEILTYDKVLKNLKGTKYYKKEEFEEAKMEFNENAIKNPNDGRLHYNLGNSLYKNGKLEDAENSYNLSLRDQEFQDRSFAYQNLGNVKFEQKDYKNAITNYRNALIEDPQNLNARYNYELASRFLQRQQNQQQQQQQNKDDKNKDQEKKEKQQNQDQEKKEQEKQEQKQDQQKSEEEKKQEQQQKQEQAKKDEKKKDAEKMLKALLQKEKEEMKKEKAKMNVDKAKKGKFW